jgi:hypothetical protein
MLGQKSRNFDKYSELTVEGKRYYKNRVIRRSGDRVNKKPSRLQTRFLLTRSSEHPITYFCSALRRRMKAGTSRSSS